MVEQWLSISWEEVWLIPLSAAAMLVAATIVIRMVGPRALSKMTNTDFVVTVALGSVVAGTVSTSTSLANGALALTMLLVLQFVLAWLRRHTAIESVVDNDPLLLMDGQEVLDEHLTQARVTENDLRAKLREANVTHMDQVLAVVLETTGDLSVLHGDGPLDRRLLDGVRCPDSA